MRTILASFLSLALLSGGVQAQFDLGQATTRSSLIADSITIAPGESFQVALKLSHPEHWHSFYKNDGVGLPEVLEIEWTLPDGFSASGLIFPVPEEFRAGGMTSYGYEGTNYFLTTITAPADLKIGETFALEAAAKWQICELRCVQESKRFTLEFEAATGFLENPEFSAIAEYLIEKVPTVVLPADWEIRASESDGRIELSVTGTPADGLKFYEIDRQIDVQQPRSVQAVGGASLFLGQRNLGNLHSKVFPDQLPRLRGILVSGTGLPGSDRRAFWIDVPLDQGSGSLAVAAEPGSQMGVALVFLSLLIGGLVLNLMPCVFPVVGLKIMGFVNQAGEEKAKIKLHGIAFTVGVLLSFLALAAFLYPIKSEKSLGAQMAEPWVVFSLIVVFLLLALSMSGVFEIGTRATAVGGRLAHRDGLAGSFFSGVLAVVVATPCSAPFLGPAIGAAWKFDGALFFMALLVMGVGLSLPYIVLSFFPSLVSRLPRPGAWMESFKQGMAFLLYAAVGYLIWVYSSQIGEEGQKGLAIMLGITAIAFAAWIYGRWGTLARKRGVRLAGYAAACLVFLIGVFLAKPAAVADDGVPAFEWGKWSPEKVEELLAAGQPVYVDFTARWCLTCQTNKASAYTAEVRRRFHEQGIVTLKADMTVTDPAADKAIHELGRAAIPVNALYVPGAGAPHVTREVLTPGYLNGLIEDQLGG